LSTISNARRSKGSASACLPSRAHTAPSPLSTMPTVLLASLDGLEHYQRLA